MGITRFVEPNSVDGEVQSVQHCSLQFLRLLGPSTEKCKQKEQASYLFKMLSIPWWKKIERLCNSILRCIIFKTLILRKALMNLLHSKLNPSKLLLKAEVLRFHISHKKYKCNEGLMGGGVLCFPRHSILHFNPSTLKMYHLTMCYLV